MQKNVPVRTFAEWEDPLPGDMEADLVSHGGDSATGSFVHTLTLTDVASGWTECVALVVRDGALVAAALEQLRQTMPFPLRGLPLRDLPWVGDVRIIAGVRIVELEPSARASGASGYLDELGPRLAAAFLERGLLLRPLGNVLYFMPPYVIRDAEVDWALEQIREVVEAL